MLKNVKKKKRIFQRKKENWRKYLHLFKESEALNLILLLRVSFFVENHVPSFWKTIKMVCKIVYLQIFFFVDSIKKEI